MMTAATLLTTSVITNSTNPAASSADSWDFVALPKFAGDQRRHGLGSGFEDPGLDDVRRRDDDQDGRRLAQRPAEGEHRPADDSALAERQHDLRATPKRVPPSAIAASRSPSGAWSNTLA